MLTESEKDKALERWRGAASAVEAVVSADDGETTTATLYRQSHSARERMQRAALGCAACWGLAVASILIPVAHFVLVPGFLVAGPVLAWLRTTERSVVLGGIVDCPECQEQMLLGRSRDAGPLSVLCENCRAPLRIEPSKGEQS
jgi:hypothetical protein